MKTNSQAWLASVALGAVLMMALAGCGTTPRSDARELPTSSDQTAAQKRGLIRLQLAVGYFEQRNFEVALDEVKQALNLSPDFADAYGVRALIYMEMGETRLADDNFSRGLKLAPNNPDLLSNYGWYLCKSGRVEESIAQFEAALANRSYTSPGKALNNAGTCSLKIKKIKEAEQYFLAAFKVEPGNITSNLNLAKFYFRERPDMERAEFYISRVIKSAQGEQLPADVLWLAIRIYHKVGDIALETSTGTQLRRYHAASPEYAAYQRGAFNE
ncbi:MAG: type pilus biosis/stability protein PilW [Pseudomonadota bacterium]|jgi:type IV pilus assembly protein PilF